MPRKDRQPIRIWQGLLLIFFGIVLALLLLEGGMRLAGFVILHVQERENLRALRAGGEVTVLCLGESTTAGGYPAFLAEELNLRLGAPRFAVINGGIAGTDTTAILKRLEGNLEKYRPEIVVAMMGINDPETGVFRRRLRPGESGSFWRSLRVYKLGASLLAHIRVKLGGGSTDLDELYRARLRPGPLPSPSAPPPVESARARGRRLLREGSYAEAAAAWEKVLERHPGDIPAARHRAESLRLSGRKDRALGLARELRLRHPGHGGAALEYARCLAAAGFPAAAAGAYEDAIVLLPADSSPCFELARLLRRRGDGEESLAAAREGCRRDPAAAADYGNELIARADAALVDGDLDKVEGFCLEVLELIPDHLRALQSYVDLRRRQGRQLEALSYCRALLADRPEDAQILAHLGSLLTDLNQFDEAEKVLLEAIDLSLEQNGPAAIANYGPIGFSRLVNLYLGRGDFARVRELCLNILEVAPESPRVLRALASACESLGEKARAGEYRGLAETLEAGRGHPVTEDNYRRLALLLRERGIRLVAVQYPCRAPADLRALLAGVEEGVIFVDNEQCFREGVAREGVTDYFIDLFAGDFGHMTKKGKRLLAANVAEAILAAPPLPRN